MTMRTAIVLAGLTMLGANYALLAFVLQPVKWRLADSKQAATDNAAIAEYDR
jgi:hypothetical protein